MNLEYRKEFCDDFLCEYYRIHELNNVNELIQEYDNYLDDKQKYKILYTLDDLGQACYTSMHSTMSNELDGGQWLLEANIDPSWMDGNYPRDDLDFEQRFHIRSLGFERGLSRIVLDDIYKKDLVLDEDSKKEIIEANNNLLALMDRESYLLKVPVQYSYETIYAFPNGYFSCDLSPFENCMLAKYLENSFSYKLFGIGASYITFRKCRQLSEVEINRLLEFLMRIYAEGKDQDIYKMFRDTIAKKELLVLRFSE